MLPAGVFIRKPGDFAVEGNGPQDEVEPELIFFDKAYTVRGHRGDPGLAGKGIAVGHLVTGRHLHIQVVCAVLFEGLQQLEII